MADKKDSKTKLSREQVLHLAKLVNLSLSDEEIERFQSQLGETIDYIQNLNELDTSKIVETSHAVNLKNVAFEDGASSPRTFTQSQALANAKNAKSGHFAVPKILDK